LNNFIKDPYAGFSKFGPKGELVYAGKKAYDQMVKLRSEVLYDEPKFAGHHWGMNVDMNACTGCGSCVVSCGAENNIPVVGKNEMKRRHDLAWMRIDRYYITSDRGHEDDGFENPKVVHQPVMCQHCGVPFTIFRPHNIYGPRMGMAHVIPELLRRVWDIQSPQPLEVYSVDHCRSFCYVDDLVVGLMRLMRTEDHCTGPVNLGNPDEFQIKELAERVLALVGSRSKIIYKELPQDDPQQRRPDITLAKAQLNWQPSIALEEGLCRTVEYFRALLAQGDPKAG